MRYMYIISDRSFVMRWKGGGGGGGLGFEGGPLKKMALKGG